MLFFALGERGGGELDNWRSAHLDAGEEHPIVFFRETARPQIQLWQDLKTILLSTVDYYMVATPNSGRVPYCPTCGLKLTAAPTVRIAASGGGAPQVIDAILSDMAASSVYETPPSQ